LKLLLDTHIWLWSLREPDRLGRRVQRELKSASNELWLSPISVWEAVLLHRKGRLQLHVDLSAWLLRATARMREAPLTWEIAFLAPQLALQHQDPADRFLAATAKLFDLALVTADERLLAFSDIKTLPNN